MHCLGFLMPPLPLCFKSISDLWWLASAVLMRNGLELSQNSAQILLSNSQHTLTTLSYNFWGLFFCAYSFIHSGIGLSGLINIIAYLYRRHATRVLVHSQTLSTLTARHQVAEDPCAEPFLRTPPPAASPERERKTPSLTQPFYHGRTFAPLRQYFVFKFKLSNFYTVCSLKPTCQTLQASSTHVRPT